MDFMREALKEAYEGINNRHGGPFGCVIVKDGQIIGQGHNRVLIKHDPTCHGEMEAIRDACEKTGSHDLTGCELYTTAEPCPMCLGAILWANIAKVYYGCNVSDTDKIGFRDDKFYDFFNGEKNILTLEESDRKECKKLFDEYNPDASYASWAIRFVASLEGILTVLSGMSNTAQMKDNLSYMKDFKPLNEEERVIIRKAQEIMGRSATIPCTACSYCTKGCPKQIPIPDIFAAMNKRLGDGQMAEAKAAYDEITSKGPGADACVSCGQCENVCPQHIKIISELKRCNEALG